MPKQIVVENLLLSYSEARGDGGAVLLFLHGWRSSKEIWTKIVELINQSANQPISCYALDLPGFGGSQVPTKPMTVGDYAEIIQEFIKKLELKNVIIIGHSFGGRIGIKLASQKPELLSKLILVDSAGFAMDSSKKTIMGLGAKLAKPFFKPGFMRPLRKKIYQALGAEDYLATPELQKTFVNITSEDLSTDMKKIQVPTLIITAENDRDTPVAFGQRMHSLILNSQFRVLKNAGHFSFLDQPEEFVAELREFIAQK